MVPITEDLIPEGEDSAGMVSIKVSDMDQRPPIEHPYEIPAAIGPSPSLHERTNIKRPIIVTDPSIRHTFLRPSLSEKNPLNTNIRHVYNSQY